MTWVWKNGPKTGTHRFVLLALADFCDENGCAWPSMKRIAERACMTERGAQKIIRQLEASGWLMTVVGGGRGGVNQYRIPMQNPEQQTPNDVLPPNDIHRIQKQEPRTAKQETPNRRSPEPSVTIIEPSLREKSARDALADVVGLDVADAFIGHRKALRKPMTSKAGELMATRLAQMRDPMAAVLRSIENGWQGVFEDERKNGQASRSVETTDAWIAGARRIT